MSLLMNFRIYNFFAYIQADFSNQIRHFMRTTELVDDVVQQNDLYDDDGASGDDGDDWDLQVEALWPPKAKLKRMKNKLNKTITI